MNKMKNENSDCKQFDNMTEKEIEQYFTEYNAGCPYQTKQEHHNRPLTAKQVNIMFKAMEKVRLINLSKRQLVLTVLIICLENGKNGAWFTLKGSPVSTRGTPLLKTPW
jgi:hypothetical protein